MCPSPVERDCVLRLLFGGGWFGTARGPSSVVGDMKQCSRKREKHG